MPAPFSPSVAVLLALLQPFDLDILQHACNQALTPTELEGQGLLQATPTGWEMPETQRQTILDTRHNDPAHVHAAYRILITSATALLDGNAAAEARLVALVRTAAELILKQDPVGLTALLELIPLEALQERSHQHLIRYYRGLGAGLRDQFADAATQFDSLLEEPDLDPVIRGRTLNSDATFARYSGNYQRALAGYRASFALWEQQGDRVRQAYVLLNEGSLRYHLQEYAAAQAALDASLATLGEYDLVYPQALVHINLGLIARDQCQFEVAKAHFEQARVILEAEGAQDFLGRVANNLGEIALLKGDYAQARDWFTQALGQMTTRVYHIDAYLNCGLAYHAEGQLEAAQAAYHEALILIEELDRREIAALAHFRLGQVAAARADAATAQSQYHQAMVCVETMRDPVAVESLQVSLMGRWQAVYEALIQVCLQRGDVQQAFLVSEQARARALADLLARESTVGTSFDVAAFQKLLQPGMIVLSYFTTGIFGVDLPLLAGLPPEAQALRTLQIQPATIWLFVVERDTITAHECKIDPSLLLAHSAMQYDGRRFLRTGILQKLYTVLMEPIAAQLQQAKHVWIMPHGPLHQVPWSALQTADRQYVLDLLPTISQVPSATTLEQLLRRPPSMAPQRCLTFSYEGGTDRELPSTHHEAAEVAHLFDGVHRQSSATIKATLAAEVQDYRLLHFACHGVFVLDKPLNSWLQLGPDQTISAAEILATWNLDADLVTLSACQSGVSQIFRGDEPFGLVRALLGTGARCALVTLWPIDDMITHQFMRHFYRLLHTGQSPAQALRQAKINVQAMSATELQAAGYDLPTLGEGNEYPFAVVDCWSTYQLIGAGISISSPNEPS